MDKLYPFALPEGTILAGQYIIKKVLGQGGFGITYVATDHKSGNNVAVKEFFPDTLAYREKTSVITYPDERSDSYEYGKTGFLEEAKTLAEFIGNDNIIKIHSYFEENGTAYFVMDYIEGVSFDEYLKQKGGKITVEEAERILIPIMDALQLVHSKGIVHRDVTPDNIYICNDGTIKLLDFGAARYSLGDKSRSLDVILKHGFAPKEQYTKRGKQGAFTDVYSLAATFYFSITGKRPPDSIERIDDDNLIPPSLLGVKITEYQENALLQALEVMPNDRFKSMADFKRVLLNEKQTEAAAAVAAPVVTAAPAKPVEPKPAPIEYKKPVEPAPTVAKQDNGSKKKVIIGVVAAAAVAVIGLSIFLMLGKDKDDAITTAESSSSQSASADISTSGDSSSDESTADDSKPDDSKSDSSEPDNSKSQETTKAKETEKTESKAAESTTTNATTSNGATTKAAGTTKATNTTKGTTKQTTKQTTPTTKQTTKQTDPRPDGKVLLVANCGENGDNLIFTSYSSRVATVTGKGKMRDTEYSSTSAKGAQWRWSSPNTDKLIICDGVTSIGEFAFIGFSYLNSVSISNTVTSIGGEAFRDCEALKSITIPNGVASIGGFAFSGCSSLKSVTLSSGVTSIGRYAFDVPCLKSITIPSSVTSIGDYAFGYDNGSKISSFTIYGKSGSAAEKYAQKNGFTFVAI